jgi:hypothetical protein
MYLTVNWQTYYVTQVLANFIHMKEDNQSLDENNQQSGLTLQVAFHSMLEPSRVRHVHRSNRFWRTDQKHTDHENTAPTNLSLAQKHILRAAVVHDPQVVQQQLQHDNQVLQHDEEQDRVHSVH